MTTLQVRVEERLKYGAEQKFRAMGLSMADGVRSYLNYVNIHGKLPFEPVSDPWYDHNNSAHVPNADTSKAIKNAKKGKDVEEFDDIDKMFASLGA